MSGIFDRLHGQIGSGADEDQGGISLLDLADLPPEQQKLMRLMITEVEMSYEDLCEEFVGALMSQEELDQALEELTRQRWLIRMGEEHIRYEANLRRKKGSDLARSVWSALDGRIADQRRAREALDEELGEEQ